MTTRIVRTGPIAPIARGVQVPPTLADRVAASSLIIAGRIIVDGAGGGRQLIVDEILKGGAADVAPDALRSIALPATEVAEQAVVVLVAPDRDGRLRLVADPRSVDRDAVAAILAGMVDEAGECGD